MFANMLFTLLSNLVSSKPKHIERSDCIYTLLKIYRQQKFNDMKFDKCKIFLGLQIGLHL